MMVGLIGIVININIILFFGVIRRVGIFVVIYIISIIVRIFIRLSCIVINVDCIVVVVKFRIV